MSSRCATHPAKISFIFSRQLPSLTDTSNFNRTWLQLQQHSFARSRRIVRQTLRMSKQIVTFFLNCLQKNLRLADDLILFFLRPLAVELILQNSGNFANVPSSLGPKWQSYVVSIFSLSKLACFLVNFILCLRSCYAVLAESSKSACHVSRQSTFAVNWG